MVMPSGNCKSWSRTTRQFFLLIYKNFKLQSRRPLGTIAELLLPITGVVFIVCLRHFLDFKKENRCFTTTEPDPLKITEQPSSSGNYSVSLYLHYAPSTMDTDAIMNIVRREISIPVRFYAHNTEKDVLRSIDSFNRKTTSQKLCFKRGAGIIFSNLTGDKLLYKIRLPHEVGRSNSWHTIQSSPNYESPGPRTTNLYLSEGFLQLQKFIGNAIIEWRTKKEKLYYSPVNVYVRQLPHPEYSVDAFLAKVNIIIPILFMLTFLYSAGAIVKELVLEKETRIKESMLMMGLKPWILWSSWFFKEFFFLLGPVVVMTTIVKLLLFKHSDGFLIFMFFIIYIISLISFSFFISIWFDSARLSLIMAFLIWIGSFCPFLFLIFRYRITHYGIIFISCLLSNTAFGFGIEIIARLEQQKIGLKWNNLADPITIDESFNMAWILGMQLVDSIIYLIATWYISEVKPGRYGVPKPIYFPLMPSYWCGRVHCSNSEQLRIVKSFVYDDPSAHEKVRGKLEVGISIRNLTKIYSTWFGSKGIRKKAVDNLSLDTYKGQITALLGHNGAGKTTTMSVLTGLLTPTEGNVIINGYSILTDIGTIRDNLGICPQHNVLFDRLTVREHLKFFMWLKGIHDKERVKSEVDQMIEDLLLSGKSNIQASRLSGGMKRKLSVGIALIGGSELVILDEPTAGMDPYARRATWDLLGKYKQNCCIFMSTHLMDEADLLGDRIAIMAEGKLCCSGSSLFLKSRYGVGYHMTLVKQPNCATFNVEVFVKSFVPSAKKVTDVGMELSFILPSSEVSKFSDLFDDLERLKEDLGVASFGISITTMEEVFLKVGEDTDKALKFSMEKKHSTVLEAVKKRERKRRNLSFKPITWNTKTAQIHSNNNGPKSPSTTWLLSKTNPANEVSEMQSQSLIKGKSHESILEVSQSISADYKLPTKYYADTNYACDSPSMKVVQDNLEERGQQVSIEEKQSIPKPLTGVDSTEVRFHCTNRENDHSCIDSKMEKKSNTVLPPLPGNLESKLSHSRFGHPSKELRRSVRPLPPISARSSFPMKHDYDLASSTSRDETSLAVHYIRNEGLTLWLQQFRGMFVKKLCYSARFYPSLFIQLFFPVVFTTVGLLVVLSFPKQDDPPLVLNISTTGLNRRNTTVFYAELDGKSMGFSGFTANEISVTNYFDISTGVNELRNSVKHISNIDDCCDYEYQLLDKFCASRNAIDLEHCSKKNSSFSYTSCLVCLKCCYAYKKSSSCTYPSTKYLSTAKYCPTPPSLSLHSSTSGPLDTTSTFVMEYILRTAKSSGSVSFFRAYQAGFTISYQEPDIKVCDCAKVDGKSVRGCSILETLNEKDCKTDLSCPTITMTPFGACPLKPFNQTICRKEPTCYKPDIYSLDIFEYFICHDGDVNCKLDPSESWHRSYDFYFSSNKRSMSMVHPEYLKNAAVTVWFNNGGYHMAASAFSTFQNIHLKQVTKNRNLSMAVTNHPLPRDVDIVAQDVVGDFTGFGLSILGLFGYSFFLANFVIFLVKEKESKVKHLQFVSGVNASSYWLSAFMWDLINSCLPISLTIIIFRTFPVDAYHGTAISAILLVLIFTCWAGIPFTYIASFIFNNSLAAFSALLAIFFLLSVGFVTTIFLINLFGRENKNEVTEALHFTFLLSPTYGLASTLSDLFVNQKIMNFCVQNYNICDYLNLTYVNDPLTWKRPGVGATCTYLIVQGFLYIFITILLELNFFIPQLRRFFYKFHRETNFITPQMPGEDDDVYFEKRRVMNADTVNDAVIIKNLVKVYHGYLMGCSVKQPKIAVDGISLGIGKGECFGLLGVNGAGKTTTFNILTGDISMTSGTAVIANNDIRTSLKNVRQGLGYCPQFDALIECMTAFEILWMFSRLRGVPEDCIYRVVDAELRRLDLVRYANKKCGTYSGGVKRKLSTAIAMIGSPPIILLDEPTNGMDPNTRRYLWDVLTKVTREGKSIILTSHSMEECEALCTRLAIMVNGQFKCLGSIQHLKNKYGSGITLQAKVKHCYKDSNFDQIELRRKIHMLFSNLASSQASFRRRSHFFSWQYNRSRGSSFIGGVFPSIRTSQESLDTAHLYDTTLLHTFIKTNFKGALLLEEHVGAVTYLLPTDQLSWSFVFRLLEENKEELGIVDYSVSQTTLEQVFINFAKEQEEQLESS